MTDESRYAVEVLENSIDASESFVVIGTTSDYANLAKAQVEPLMLFAGWSTLSQTIAELIAAGTFAWGPPSPEVVMQTTMHVRQAD